MKTQLIIYIISALIFCLAVFGVLVWLGNTQMISLTVFDTVIETSAQKGFLALVGYTVGIIVTWAFLRFIWDLPRRLVTGVSRRKQGQALEALEDAMIAASAGDVDKARKKASRARNLINRPVLAKIVSAQAAEVSGDPTEAEAQYKDMLGDEKTRRVAQRGLAGIAYSRGDMPGAISHAQSAYADNKNAKWAFDIMFNAQVSDSQWEAALETLNSGEKRKHVSKDIARRRRAAVMTARADELAANGEGESARELAVKAASDEPGFAPAVALAAKLLVQDGNENKAGKLIEKAWASAPHPALAIAYRDLKTNESSKARAKRLQSLIKQNSPHRESVILGVEEALKSGDGVTAWGQLRPLVNEDAPSSRLCELAASAETLCENQADAKLWASRALTAPAEPNWSDLDPDGDAFNYSDTDWRRLIHSYGDNNTLIHPRHERFERLRPVMDPAALSDATPTPEADDIVKMPTMIDAPIATIELPKT